MVLVEVTLHSFFRQTSWFDNVSVNNGGVKLWQQKAETAAFG